MTQMTYPFPENDLAEELKQVHKCEKCYLTPDLSTMLCQLCEGVK